MKVIELIEMLERLPENALIGVANDDYNDYSVYPIQIVQDSDVIDHTVRYCANEEDLENGEWCDEEDICVEGYCLLSDSESVPCSYMMLDENGNPMPETEEWD